MMTPGSNPKEHRCTIKATKLVVTTVLVGLLNIEQTIEACRELVQGERAEDIALCPGFSQQAVASIVEAVDDEAAVSVAGSDSHGMLSTGKALAKASWFAGKP